MAFKTTIQNPLCRTVDLTQTRWEFEAPQFFDFSRVHEKETDVYDYFSMYCVQLRIFVNY